jgi:hypothetical protein
MGECSIFQPLPELTLLTVEHTNATDSDYGGVDFSLFTIYNLGLGIGHWALGIGDWGLVIGSW